MDTNKLLIDAHKLIISGKGLEAEIILKKILRFDPLNIFAINNLGNLSFVQNKFEESLKYFNKSLRLKPDFCEAFVNKASCLEKLKRYSEALDCYKDAIKIKPDLIDIYYNKGNCLTKLKRFEEAVDNYNIFLKTKPKSFKTIFNKGYCFEKLKLYERALEYYNQAIDYNPNFYQALNQKGNCLQRLHFYDDAIECYKKAIELKSDFIDAINNLGHLQLLMGNYEEGWKNYEWRKKINKDYYFKSEKISEWRGKQNLKDKKIFISREQGLGDYIQFCRYLPMLKKLGAKIMLDPPKKLKPLLNSMKLDYSIVDPKNINKIKLDYYCSISSLPLAFKTSLNNIPNITPYLFIDEKKIFFWEKKINKNKKNIGIKWTGNKSYWDDQNRSTSLNKIKSLFDLSYEFHSLEIEYSKDDLNMMKNIKNLHCYKNELIGFENTAGLIENMDLIITTDTSIAHLCGALNKKAWVMLSDLPDFRWLLNRDDSPWYPSLKLYRQKKSNDWGNLIKSIKKDLNV